MFVEADLTLSQSGTLDIDVFDFAGLDAGAGAGNDVFGQDVEMTEITTVLVHNQSTSPSFITVGNKNTTAAWNSPFNASDTGAITIHEGGFALLHAPTNPAYAVADSDNHILTITANSTSGTYTYDVIFIGRSA